MKKNNLKRLLAAMMASALSLSLLAGCGGEKTNTEPEPSANVPNPLTEITAEELGVSMNVPDGAGDVKYFTLDDGSDVPVYQMDFTCGGHAYTYRAQSTGGSDAYDMSGLHYDSWDSEPVDISYCSGIAMTNSEAAAVYWIDVVPGINYTLCCSEAVSCEEITEIANAVFVSMQGESEADDVAPEDDAMSFIALSIPDGAENPIYYSEGNLSQMEFDYDFAHFVYSAEFTNELEAYDMSGIESSDWRSGDVQVGHCSAVARDCDTASVIYWLDVVPGVNYTLSCDRNIAVEELIEIANGIFQPLQSEVD